MMCARSMTAGLFVLRLLELIRDGQGLTVAFDDSQILDLDSSIDLITL